MKDQSYTALVSPDTYDYLDSADPEEFINDPLLDEVDEMEDSSLDEDSDDEVPLNSPDDSDAYASDLFDLDDDEFTDSEVEKESPVYEDKMMFSEDEDDNLVINEEPEGKEQKTEIRIPQLVTDIMSFCGDRYNGIIQYLGRCTSEELTALCGVIEKARDAFFMDGKDKMFSIPETDITFAIVSDKSDPMLSTQRLQFIAAQMLVRGKGFWNFAVLEFSEDHSLKKADFHSVSRSIFTEGEWRIAQNMAQQLREKGR